MSTTVRRMTVDDYYAITVEGDRKQLVDGEIVVKDPIVIHAVLQARLLFALMSWIREGGSGIAIPSTDVRLSEHDLYGPDVVWIAEDPPPLDQLGQLGGVPDLCVEVRSPSTWRHDLGPKRHGYERGGLPELWLVDDEDRRVLVHRRSRADAPRFDVGLELHVGDELISPQLPGFALPLEDLFRP